MKLLYRQGPFLVLLTCLTLVFLAANTRAQSNNSAPPLTPAELVILTDQQGEYPLGRYLEILEDPGGQLTIADVASPGFEARFVPNQVETPNLGYTGSAIWVRFRVKDEANSTTEWRLALQDARMGYVDLYLPASDGSGYSKKAAGRLLPFTAREVPYHHFVFTLPLAPQREQMIYLRLQSEAAMVFPLKLWSLSAFAQAAQTELFGLGLFYGALLIVTGYNLFLFFSLRDQSYLYLVLFIAAFLLNQGSRDGLAHQFLWPAWSNHYGIQLFGFLAVVTGLKFSQTFLETSKYTPKLHKVILILMAAAGVMIVVLPLVGFTTAALSALSLLAVPVTITAGFFTWRQGHVSARYYLLAWFIFLGMVAIFQLTAFGLLPSNTLTEKGQLLGSVLLVLLFSLALAHRIGRLKADAEQANRHLAQSEHRLLQFLEAMPVGVAVMNALTGNYQYGNQRARQMFDQPQPLPDRGITPVEVTSAIPFYKMGTDQLYPLNRLPSVLALQRGQPVQTDDIEIERAGQRIALEVWSSPVFDEHGRVQYAVTAFQDITERKQAEARLHHYADRLQNLHLIDRAIAAAQSLENIAEAAFDHLQRLAPYDRASIILWDFETKEGLILAVRGHNDPAVAAGQRLPSIVFIYPEPVQAGKTVVIEDMSNLTQPPKIAQALLAAGLRSLLVAPLMMSDQIIGLFNLASRQPGAFKDEHAQLVSEATDLMAIAIQQARLRQQIDRHVEELEQRVARRTAELSRMNAALNQEFAEHKQAEEERIRFTNQLRTAAEVSRQITAILDPDRLLQMVVTLLQTRFELYHVHVYLLDETGETLFMRAGSGAVGWQLRQRGYKIPLSFEPSLVALAARKQEIILVNDVGLEANFLRNPMLPDTQAELAIPLISAGRVLGVMDLQDNHPHRFLPSDQDTLSTLAGQITIALENARLFAEHNRTQAALAQARDDALAASNLKTQLLSRVSHELRTPLNAILGYSEMLERGIYGDISDRQRKAISEILNSNETLMGLVNELLDQASLQAGKLVLKISSFTPTDIIYPVQTKLGLLAERKGLSLTCHIAPNMPAVLFGDTHRIHQILTNLVSNAIKFTETGSVEVSLFQPDSNHWALQVADTGPGIPLEAQTFVFEPFRQVDGSMTRLHGGSGLGLSIVKDLTDLMGGQVKLTSEPGKGSTFTVRLPLIEEE